MLKCPVEEREGGRGGYNYNTFCRGENISLGMVEDGEGKLGLCGRDDTNGFLVWRERTSS